MKRVLWLLPFLLMAGCATSGPQRSPGSRLTDPVIPAGPEPADWTLATRVAVLGDSVSHGLNISLHPHKPSFGWVQFWQGLGEPGLGLSPLSADETVQGLLGPQAYVRNFARAGSKISDWVADRWLAPVLAFAPRNLIVLIGGNDLLAAVQDGDFTEADQEGLARSLNRLFDKLAAGLPDTQVLVLGYYDLFDGFSERLPFVAARLRGLSLWTAQANQALEDAARARGWAYHDLGPAFRHHAYGSDLGDPDSRPEAYFRRPLAGGYDIHPNTAGHRALAQQVSAALRALTAAQALSAPVSGSSSTAD